MLYNPPTGGASNDPYVGKNTAAGIQGSKVPPGAVEFPQREIVALIAASQQSPTNTDQTQLLKGVRSGLLEFYPDTGTADALIVTPSPVFTSITDGMQFVVAKKLASGPNATTTPSLAVNGISQLIVKQDGSALAANDLPAGIIFAVRSLAGQFRVVGLRKSDITVSYSGSTFNTAVTNSITSSITTIAPLVFNDIQTQSSFTPVVVLSDLPYNTETVLKSLSVTGASYIDGYGQVAYRNDNTSSRVSFITKLRLVDTSNSSYVDAQYIGGAITPAGSGGSLQLEQQTGFKFTNLTPSKTYTLQVIGFKIDNVSPLVVLDGYVRADKA